jgi:chemotaxis protein MotB
VRIEGHTDNTPVSTPQYPSNWELSTARAMTVLRYFVAKDYVIPRKIEAVGKGPYFPIASNDTPEGRAANRRVEIYLSYIIQSGRELLFERHRGDQ